MPTQDERFAVIENELATITNEIGLKLDEHSRDIHKTQQQIAAYANTTNERLSNIETLLIRILAHLPEK